MYPIFFIHSSVDVHWVCFHALRSVQLLNCVWLFATPWTAPHQDSLSITNSWSLLKLMSIKSVMPSNHLILCHPILLLPSICPRIRVFSNESVLCIRCPKYWSFSFSISPSNEYSGLISFRIGWFGLLAAQGTLKGLLQYHSSKASIHVLDIVNSAVRNIEVQVSFWTMVFSGHMPNSVISGSHGSSVFRLSRNLHTLLSSPIGSDGKEFTCSAGDPDSNHRLGRSPGEGNGYPLQYYCLGNTIDRGAWWATVHRVTKSQTWLKWLSTHTKLHMVVQVTFSLSFNLTIF